MDNRPTKYYTIDGDSESNIRNYRSLYTCCLFQKVISENRIRSGLRQVVDSFYENLTAITEREGTLSEACRKYSSDCLQNMIQNELKHFETVVNVSFLQETDISEVDLLKFCKFTEPRNKSVKLCNLT